MEVPNVPCGVESLFWFLLDLNYSPFLMYRVELKVSLFRPTSFTHMAVPNVPCGVERIMKQ